MSQGKGKARAALVDEESGISSEPPQDSSSSTSSSILGRIGTSANSLRRSILSPPQHGSELNNLATTASAASGKGGSNGQSAGAAFVEGSAVTSPSSISTNSSTIRSGSRRSRSAQAEAEFSTFLNSDNGAPFEHSLSHGRDAGTHAARAEAEFSSILDAAEPLTVPEDKVPSRLEKEDYERFIIQRNSSGPHRTVAMQEAVDGKAVSDLLSYPEFHENVANSLPRDNLNHSAQDEDDAYWKEEEAILARLIQQDRLPKDTSAVADAIKSRPELFKNGPWNIEDGSRFQVELAHVEDKNGDIYQWYRLLTSYQDDVWGELGPLVGEAREELKTWTPEKGDILQQPTALRRLNLILGHVRQ